MRLFALVRTKGQVWDHSKELSSQNQWREHADFMNRLAADGFVVLGGPLGSGDDFLLIINAPDESTILAILAQDPWSKSGALEIKSLKPWTILLDSGQKVRIG